MHVRRETFAISSVITICDRMLTILLTAISVSDCPLKVALSVNNVRSCTTIEWG